MEEKGERKREEKKLQRENERERARQSYERSETGELKETREIFEILWGFFFAVTVFWRVLTETKGSVMGRIELQVKTLPREAHSDILATIYSSIYVQKYLDI